MSKVLEKWTSDHLKNHLNKNSFHLHPLQFGFWSNHSTESANCYFIDKIKLSLDSNSIVGAVFLDLRKAFDTVNHRILLAKLSSFNLSDKVLKWLKSYLCQSLQTVHIGNSQSEPLPLSTGLPQGSILSYSVCTLTICHWCVRRVTFKCTWMTQFCMYMDLQKLRLPTSLQMWWLKLQHGWINRVYNSMCQKLWVCSLLNHIR